MVLNLLKTFILVKCLKQNQFFSLYNPSFLYCIGSSEIQYDEESQPS